MNTPPTLDRFESALLSELRSHVATEPVMTTAVEPPRRPGRRWAAGLAGAAAIATAYVVISPGGPAVSPAYAVDETASGEVVVTVHRLEDSAGLEAALRAHGIDADVSFAEISDANGVQTFQVPDGPVRPAPPGAGGSVDRKHEGKAGARLDGTNRTEEIPAHALPEIAGCGFGDTEPATLTQEGVDWVLRIPAESPLQDRPVQLSTATDGGLFVAYAGDEPGSYCGVASLSR